MLAGTTGTSNLHEKKTIKRLSTDVNESGLYNYHT